MGINGHRMHPHRLYAASDRKVACQGQRKGRHRPAGVAPWNAGMTRPGRCGSRSIRDTRGQYHRRLHQSPLRVSEACMALAALRLSEIWVRRCPAAPLHVGTTRWTRCLLLSASTLSLRTGGRCHRMRLPGRGGA